MEFSARPPLDSEQPLPRGVFGADRTLPNVGSGFVTISARDESSTNAYHPWRCRFLRQQGPWSNCRIRPCSERFARSVCQAVVSRRLNLARHRKICPHRSSRTTLRRVVWVLVQDNHYSTNRAKVRKNTSGTTNRDSSEPYGTTGRISAISLPGGHKRAKLIRFGLITRFR